MCKTISSLKLLYTDEHSPILYLSLYFLYCPFLSKEKQNLMTRKELSNQFSLDDLLGRARIVYSARILSQTSIQPSYKVINSCHSHISDSGSCQGGRFSLHCEAMVRMVFTGVTLSSQLALLMLMISSRHLLVFDNNMLSASRSAY